MGHAERLAAADSRGEPALCADKALAAAWLCGWRLGAGHLGAWGDHGSRCTYGGAERKGAWALDDDAQETEKGFLLNHLIHELLPPRGDGLRWSNSDPITGQAAWFDLRVKIEKVPAPVRSQPAYPPITSPVGKGPDTLTWKIKT